MVLLRRILLSFICGAWALAGPVPGAGALEPELSSKLTPDFMRFFDTLALTADYGPFNNRPPWVRKWEGPVQIVLGDSAEPIRAEVERLAARITSWTELPFLVMPPGTAVTEETRNAITIRLLPRDAFVETYKSREVVCQTETHGIGGLLQIGYMVLSEGYTDCLRHEFMHALGFDSHWFPQHASEIRSVLAYRESPARTEDYSPWDIMAIKILYDWRIRAGMNREKSLSLAYEVVRERPQAAALPTRESAGAVYR